MNDRPVSLVRSGTRERHKAEMKKLKRREGAGGRARGQFGDGKWDASGKKDSQCAASEQCDTDNDYTNGKILFNNLLSFKKYIFQRGRRYLIHIANALKCSGTRRMRTDAVTTVKRDCVRLSLPFYLFIYVDTYIFFLFFAYRSDDVVPETEMNKNRTERGKAIIKNESKENATENKIEREKKKTGKKEKSERIVPVNFISISFIFLFYRIVTPCTRSREFALFPHTTAYGCCMHYVCSKRRLRGRARECEWARAPAAHFTRAPFETMKPNY